MPRSLYWLGRLRWVGPHCSLKQILSDAGSLFSDSVCFPFSILFLSVLVVFLLNPSDCHRSPCQLSHICGFTYLTLHSSAVETFSQLFPTWSSFFSTASQGPQLGHIRAGPWILRSTGSCTPAWGEGCKEIRERNGYRTTLCQRENWVLLCLRKSKSYDATFGSPLRLTDRLLNFLNTILVTDFDLPTRRIQLCQHYIIFNLSNFIEVIKGIILSGLVLWTKFVGIRSISLERVYCYWHWIIVKWGLLKSITVFHFPKEIGLENK